MEFTRLVEQQDGVITLGQAVAIGMSAATVRRRVTAGAWRRQHPRVFLVGGHRHTAQVRIRAASLWAGEHAVITGPAAAYWHGILDHPPARVEVTVPTHTKPRPRPGIALRRRDLHHIDIAHTRGIPVAAPPLAILQTAVVLPGGAVFLDRALQRHIRFPTLYRAFCRNIGRTGSTAAGRLLVAAADRADSAAERLLVKLLRAAGIQGWVLGFPFEGYRIDLAFPDDRVAVEVDGWAWHVDPVRFRTDRRKGNAITRAGWDLLRFTWHDLDTRPADVVDDVAATVSSAKRARRGA